MAGFFWNHRLVAVETFTYDDGETETTLQFCEVSYDEDTRKPIGFTTICTVGNSVDEMREMAARLAAATDLPVMELSDFPAEFIFAHLENAA